MRFDFWDNYQNMLHVVIWKNKFIPPVMDNTGVPLRLINYTLSASTVWALMSRVNGEIQIDNIEVDYSQRGTKLNRQAMKKLVETYFELYRDNLKHAEPQ